MKSPKLVTLFTSLILLGSSVSTLAESMYIDDTLLVPLRSGETLSHRIVHKGLSSGTKVNVIEHNKETGYSKIEVGSIEGYLPTRFLTAEPIARVKLEKATKSLSELEEKHKALVQELNVLKTQHAELNKNFVATEQTLNNNVQELTHIRAVSANALSLDERNQELRESNEQLRNKLELLETDNNRLKEKAESNMMLVGGGLVLLGVILALLIPLIKPSKKNDSWA